MHIVWIKTELLHPVDKGGRIRTYQMLRALRREHRITYVTLDDGTAAPDALERASEYADHVVRVPFSPPAKGTFAFYADLARNLLSPLPYAVAKYRSAALEREVKSVYAAGGVDVAVCDFLFPSLNVPVSPGIPSVLFQHNVESMIWERHSQVSVNPAARIYLREQWRRMRRWEESECRRFDKVVAVSPEDAGVFEKNYGLSDVSHVPTGVDVDYFQPSATVTREPRELVFTGSMDWMPNEDAIRWFAESILPLIQRRIPDVRLTVVGRNPPASVSALAASGSAVTVTGRVPDVRPYMDRAAAFIVPIRVGGGTRLKIYEAMAMECPVISTTVGAEGLPLAPGVHLEVADSPEAFAAAVARVLGHPEHASNLAAAAAGHVRSRFAWDRVAWAFAGICSDLAGRGTGRKDPVQLAARS